MTFAFTSETSPRARTTGWIAAMVAIGVSLALFAGGCSGGEGEGADAETYSGYVVDPPLTVDDISLPDAVSGEDIAMPAEPGALRLMFFGYLSCPDVCPTTMSDIKRALADMAPEDADRVRVSFATVDPDRDDGARMTEYLAKFVDDGQVLRTDDPAALKSAAASFGVSYQVTTNEDGEVEVGHTGDVFAVNSEGTVVMQWPFGTDPESLASDLTSLLDAEAEQTLEGSA